MLKEVSSEVMLKNFEDFKNQINLMAEFKYAPSNNYLQFELVN